MAAKIVDQALEEIETNVTFLALGMLLLDSLLIFLVFFFFTIFFKISYWFAFIPFLFYLVYRFYLVYKSNKYYSLEQKVPELNERLRTVADNKNVENEIVDSLKQDVLKDIKKVNASKLIDYNPVYYKILGITLFSIVLIFLSAYNVDLYDFNFNVPFSQGIRIGSQEQVYENLSYMEGYLEDIFGQGSIAKLGSKELNIIINPLESEINPNDIKENTDEKFNVPIYPKEIYTSYDVSYNEKIQKENQEVVKQYFQKIIR